jgi:hypothetical protein
VSGEGLDLPLYLLLHPCLLFFHGLHERVIILGEVLEEKDSGRRFAARDQGSEIRKSLLVEVHGLPLIHKNSVDEWSALDSRSE